MCSGMNMMVTSAVQYSYSRSSQERVDHLSAAMKIVAACVFCYLGPQYFQHNHSAISFPICHSYGTSFIRLFRLIRHFKIQHRTKNH
ncbi:unnamed protein product [Nippostrongylus brasiliensis]|uniref:Ovule protein n=1 Tax=Nippostrongylus brasiliensis TaxID=27835 RepID=A0A0N4XNF9_NIPBR|nr:unnamed protein product [Nippostrongylus brasiliensis]